MIPVFYSSKMVADSRSISPSAAKPAKVVESWKKFSIDIREPTPVTIDELARAHDRTYVEDVLSCRVDNGFHNRSPDVASSLPYTSGAMLSAARHAIFSKSVAVAPCSGFHHAGYQRAEGFCTFNGLMVTSLALKEEGIKKIGILDLDMHYGNGTDEILNRIGNLDGWCKHFTAGYSIEHSWQVEYFFREWLPAALEELVKCDVVLYQAGADPHIDDPFGGWMKTEELQKRDRIVFHAFKSHGVPVAWNLAGGYQVESDGSIPKVLKIHDNTMFECIRAYAP